ncbi:MAG: hypothetical protein ACRCXC_05620 [Legionella sp.]
MPQPLDKWFEEKFGAGGELGDDISGSVIQRMSLLEATAQFRNIKFSHLLIGLAVYNESLDKNVLQIDEVWDETQFEEARFALVSEATKILKPGAELLAEARHKLDRALARLPAEKAKAMKANLTLLYKE